MRGASVLFAVPLMLGLLLAAVASSSAFAVMSSTESLNGVYETTNALEGQPKPQADHITRIVGPGEIVLPTLEQIKFYVDASIESDELAASERQHEALRLSSSAERQAEEAAKVLTYKQIYKMLALWQLEKEKNAYTVQAARADGGNAI